MSGAGPSMAGIERPELTELAEVPIPWDSTALAAQVRRLSEISPWRSMGTLIVQWAVIAGSATFALYLEAWWSYTLAIVVIGSRQHALGALVHDGAHYRLLRSRVWNDIVSDLFCAYPIFASTALYRASHFAHHRWVNTDRDPDLVMSQKLERWRWPKSRPSAFLALFLTLTGLSYRSHCFMLRWNPWVVTLTGPWEPNQSRPTGWQAARLLAWTAVVVTVLSVFGLWIEYLLLWVLPAFTVLAFALYARNIAEHTETPSTSALNSTRHISSPWWERWLLSPLNSNHHLAHHLFPSVPFYRLPELQRLLASDPAFTAHAAIVERYLGFRAGDGSALGELMVMSPDQDVLR